jgi:hypothetical protein
MFFANATPSTDRIMPNPTDLTGRAGGNREAWLIIGRFVGVIHTNYIGQTLEVTCDDLANDPATEEDSCGNYDALQLHHHCVSSSFHCVTPDLVNT